MISVTMRRSVSLCVSGGGTLKTSSPSCAVVGSHTSSPLCVAVRHETTGEHHSYRPGRVTLAIRAVVQCLMPSEARKRLAMRMQRGMETVEELEKEQQWLRRHGSPLAVMGLPDHAELQEVRVRYRDLILETHPDTSAAASTNTAATTTAVINRQPDLSDYHILQQAYKIATNPNSLWHKNQASPALYSELMAHRPWLERINNRVGIFAVLCYVTMVVVGLFGAGVVFKELCIRVLEWADPDFFAFMLQQEKEEERKRELGEFVDVDPIRLAPSAIRKLAHPGRFIHGTEENPDELAFLDSKKPRHLKLST